MPLLLPPPVELIVWFGQDPVIVTLVPATKVGVVVPVPPLVTFKTPPTETAPVVVVAGVRPVPPKETLETPAALPDCVRRIHAP